MGSSSRRAGSRARRRCVSAGCSVNHSRTWRYFPVERRSSSTHADVARGVLDALPARVEDVRRQRGRVGGVDLDGEAGRVGAEVDLRRALRASRGSTRQADARPAVGGDRGLPAPSVALPSTASAGSVAVAGARRRGRRSSAELGAQVDRLGPSGSSPGRRRRRAPPASGRASGVAPGPAPGRRRASGGAAAGLVSGASTTGVSSRRRGGAGRRGGGRRRRARAAAGGGAAATGSASLEQRRVGGGAGAAWPAARSAATTVSAARQPGRAPRRPGCAEPHSRHQSWPGGHRRGAGRARAAARPSRVSVVSGLHERWSGSWTLAAARARLRAPCRAATRRSARPRSAGTSSSEKRSSTRTSRTASPSRPAAPVTAWTRSATSMPSARPRSAISVTNGSSPLRADLAAWCGAAGLASIFAGCDVRALGPLGDRHRRCGPRSPRAPSSGAARRR